MNTDQNSASAAPLPELPALSDERIDEMESSLFADISRDRTARRARRSRGWLVGGAAAAVIVVAAVISPSVGTLVGGTVTGDSAVAPVAPDAARLEGESGAATESQHLADADASKTDVAADSARDIITTASATVVVGDIPAAAEIIAEAAESRNGYVESMSVGSSGQVVPVDPRTGIAYDSTMPYPYTPDGAWITVRVPADALQSLVDQLEGVGDVSTSSISRQDVTTVTVDLEARIDAAQASVDRLTALMAQAASVADLIAAESALAERQATLESYQQQLEYYDDQVAMSTLTVTLAPDVEPVTADPAGFADGLAAGWNGLIATVNGIVIAIGFLLPWLAVIGVAGLVVWAIVAFVRARRGRGSAQKSPAATASDDEGSV